MYAITCGNGIDVKIAEMGMTDLKGNFHGLTNAVEKGRW